MGTDKKEVGFIKDIQLLNSVKAQVNEKWKSIKSERSLMTFDTIYAYLGLFETYNKHLINEPTPNQVALTEQYKNLKNLQARLSRTGRYRFHNTFPQLSKKVRKSLAKLVRAEKQALKNKLMQELKLQKVESANTKVDIGSYPQPKSEVVMGAYPNYPPLRQKEVSTYDRDMDFEYAPIAARKELTEEEQVLQDWEDEQKPHGLHEKITNNVRTFFEKDSDPKPSQTLTKTAANTGNKPGDDPRPLRPGDKKPRW